MRRLLASCLLALFSLSLIPPALLANPESQLPPCCRKDGKHGCSMRKNTATDFSGLSLQSNISTCPLYRQGSPAPAASSFATVPPTHDTAELLFTHPAPIAQTDLYYRLSFNRASQKRGPPALYS